MTDREYNLCIKIQERSTETRTNLLTFSFTTVLAILGLALTSNEDVHSITYLVPFCLIIPFQARISYYRLIHARVSAYIEIVSPKDAGFTIIGEKVQEKQTRFFAIIAALVNYEMFILSCATMCLFYSKHSFPKLQDFSILDYLMFLLPIVLSILVFAIITYAYNYSKWKDIYRIKWEASIKTPIILYDSYHR